MDRVYNLGNTQYFYQEYIENKDSLIFHNDPYFTTDHVLKKSRLVETWCKMYGLEYSGEKPDLEYNKLQYDISKEYWVKYQKPILVLHTNGGIYQQQEKPYCWTRDMPFDLAQKIADYYRKDYSIFQITKPNCKKLHGVNAVDGQYSNMELFSILLHSKKRVLIDSCLQHAAAALNLKSTVLWVGTSPKVFGYELHDNIEAKNPPNIKLPGSYLFDFDFNGPEIAYPYKEDEQLFDFKKIVKSINAQ